MRAVLLGLVLLTACGGESTTIQYVAAAGGSGSAAGETGAGTGGRLGAMLAAGSAGSVGGEASEDAGASGESASAGSTSVGGAAPSTGGEGGSAGVAGSLVAGGAGGNGGAGAGGVAGAAGHGGASGAAGQAGHGGSGAGGAGGNASGGAGGAFTCPTPEQFCVGTTNIHGVCGSFTWYAGCGDPPICSHNCVPKTNTYCADPNELGTLNATCASVWGDDNVCTPQSSGVCTKVDIVTTPDAKHYCCESVPPNGAPCVLKKGTGGNADMWVCTPPS